MPLADPAAEALTKLLGPLWRNELANSGDIVDVLGGAQLADVWRSARDPGALLRLVGGFATHAQLAAAALASARSAAARGPSGLGDVVAALQSHAERVEDVRENEIAAELSTISSALERMWRTSDDADNASDRAAVECVQHLVHVIRDDRGREAWNSACLAARTACDASPESAEQLANAVRELVACPTDAQLCGPDPKWAQRGSKRRTGKTRFA